MSRGALEIARLVVAVACGGPQQAVTPARPTSREPGVGIHKIQHVVVIMQENRSFDQYFGTYPGADGLPRQGGQFTVCVPDPLTGICVRPYHDPSDRTGGGPHGSKSAIADINGGKMDGFIAQAQGGKKKCVEAVAPNPTHSAKQSLHGYKDAREIPNYWSYAQHYVLQDH